MKKLGNTIYNISYVTLIYICQVKICLHTQINMDLCHVIVKEEEVDEEKNSIMLQERSGLFLKNVVEVEKVEEEGCQVFLKEDIKEEEGNISCSEEDNPEGCVLQVFLNFFVIIPNSCPYI